MVFHVLTNHKKHKKWTACKLQLQQNETLVIASHRIEVSCSCQNLPVELECTGPATCEIRAPLNISCLHLIENEWFSEHPSTRPSVHPSMDQSSESRYRLQYSKQLKPMPPNRADHSTRSPAPAYRTDSPSSLDISQMERNMGAPGGSMPVASRVFTTSRGVVRMEDRAEDTDPAATNYRIIIIAIVDREQSIVQFMNDGANHLSPTHSPPPPRSHRSRLA